MRYFGGAAVSLMSFLALSIQEVQGYAFEPQQFAILAVIGPNHHQSNGQRFRTFREQPPRARRHVDAVVARRVVMPASIVERPRTGRGQVAMPRTAVAFAVPEDRQVPRIILVRQ